MLLFRDFNNLVELNCLNESIQLPNPHETTKIFESDFGYIDLFENYNETKYYSDLINPYRL